MGFNSAFKGLMITVDGDNEAIKRAQLQEKNKQRFFFL